MSLTTPQDILVTIIVPNDTNTKPNGNSKSNNNPPLIRTERRITPTWTIHHLKTKLEPITGIPATSQSLFTWDTLNPDTTNTKLPLDEGTDTLQNPRYGLRRYSTIEVHDLRPPAARTNLVNVDEVQKYEMPRGQYERLEDSVLAWKRRQKLGRFDPAAAASTAVSSPEEKTRRDLEVVVRKGVEVGRRCVVSGVGERRGTVRFVGEVDGLGGEAERGCVWVGVELDEPLGRNDGSVQVEGSDGRMETRRLFECHGKGDKFGVLARPDKVEVGDYPPLDDLMDDEDMEEI